MELSVVMSRVAEIVLRALELRQSSLVFLQIITVLLPCNSLGALCCSVTYEIGRGGWFGSLCWCQLGGVLILVEVTVRCIQNLQQFVPLHFKPFLILFEREIVNLARNVYAPGCKLLILI